MATIAAIITNKWRRGRELLDHDGPEATYAFAITSGVGNLNVAAALGLPTDRSVFAKKHNDLSVTLYSNDGHAIERMWVATGQERRLALNALHNA